MVRGRARGLGWGVGGVPGGSVGGGVQVGRLGVVRGGAVQVGRFGVVLGGRHRLPFPPLLDPPHHSSPNLPSNAPSPQGGLRPTVSLGGSWCPEPRIPPPPGGTVSAIPSDGQQVDNAMPAGPLHLRFYSLHVCGLLGGGGAGTVTFRHFGHVPTPLPFGKTHPMRNHEDRCAPDALQSPVLDTDTPVVHESISIKINKNKGQLEAQVRESISKVGGMSVLGGWPRSAVQGAVLCYCGNCKGWGGGGGAPLVVACFCCVPQVC